MAARFLIHPNLPSGRVTTLLLGEKYVPILGKNLEKLGIKVLKIPKNPDVSEAVSSHADISACHLGGNILVAAQAVYDGLREILPENVNIKRALYPQKPLYPDESSLNACIIGDRLLHNLQVSDPELLRIARESHFRSYGVRQGYAKCSVCIINNYKIITSDAGVCKTASDLGLECLLISAGNILLPGYDTGFIGGCAVKLSRDELAFTGRLDGHPDAKKIVGFIKAAGVKIKYLTDEPVFDVGSMIPLEEEL